MPNGMRRGQKPGRPDDLKHGARAPDDVREPKPWAAWLHPLAMLASLPTYPAQWFVTRYVDNTIKNREFVPTVRLGLGILSCFLVVVVPAVHRRGADCTCRMGMADRGAGVVLGTSQARAFLPGPPRNSTTAQTPPTDAAFWHDAAAWRRFATLGKPTVAAVNN